MRTLGVFNILAVALLFLAAGMVVVPDAESRRTIVTEVAAVRALQRIASLQHALRASGALDRDADGKGEFGFLSDLAERYDLPLGPPGPDGSCPLLAGAYRVAVLLPDRDGLPVPPGRSAPVDPSIAAKTFLAIAWPVEPGRGACRAYAVHHSLIVHEHQNERRRIQGATLPRARLPRLAHRDAATGRVLLASGWRHGWQPFLDHAQATEMKRRLEELDLPVPEDIQMVLDG